MISNAHLTGRPSGLNADCSDGMPRMPSARLQAIEARLDITWVAVQTIQVAVAQFQKQLSDQQRARLTPFSLPQRHSSDVVLALNEARCWSANPHPTALMLTLHWTQFELRKASNNIEGN